MILVMKNEQVAQQVLGRLAKCVRTRGTRGFCDD